MAEANKYFPHLFSPIKVGTKTIKNRIEAAPALFAFLHFIEGDAFHYVGPGPERAFRMLKAKAQGGAGSVVLGELSPNHTYDKRFPFEPDIDYTSRDDEIFEIMKKTAQMIKSYGALPLGELISTGEIKTNYGNGINPKGPSPKDLEDGVTHVEPFTKEEIQELIQDYITACKWFRDAGWEGVMVHCGHGWLPAQFLSPYYNKREDEYGGSFENRARFTTELLSGIRKAMGDDFLIEIRVSSDEHLAKGLTLEDAVAYCKLCEPYIDLIHVSCGHYLSSSRSWEFTTTYAPHGANIENAAIIKQNVSVPVVVIGGINSPEQAEEAIASGKVDMISMGRQFFSDPAFPNKAKEGRADEIRRCLRCGRCYPGPSGEHETEKWTIKFPPLDSCTINPDTVWPASHHKIMPELMPKPEASRKVLIIGGGCGGMQGAITAADRGHQVILCEKGEKLGGLINFTDHTDHKIDIRNFKDLLVREVNKRPVEVRLNCEVTPQMIKEIGPDAVIVAAGSDDLILPIEGIDKAMTAMEVYEQDFAGLGTSTIVLGGGLVGCEAACDYIDHGVKTTIVEMQECLMPEITGLYRTAVHDTLDKTGAKYEVNAKVVKVGKDFVVAEQNGQEITLKADTVVNAMGRRAHDVTELVEAVKKMDIPCWNIGDSVKARQIGDAVREAWTAAMEII
ncbi:FAD-dependent oxidoreductase [Eubacterium oxidoreducens]|uniref:2,4-dienoyl-CoA reductase n=1 Tax=Eubacterium oxidoreducens TaxID=1732 RepID=A0A1G6A4T1_EUBOX|nr:FAD-dependent oxidoreductase [Eubacterium oxidoreducens]SDB03427.1 2,4-dienoyl-CoA reductase [Eubacterium oxidoreducens]